MKLVPEVNLYIPDYVSGKLPNRQYFYKVIDFVINRLHK
jgi:hypothetical protein